MEIGIEKILFILFFFDVTYDYLSDDNTKEFLISLNKNYGFDSKVCLQYQIWFFKISHFKYFEIMGFIFEKIVNNKTIASCSVTLCFIWAINSIKVK